MKRLVYLALLLFPSALLAQTVNGVPLKNINVEYVQIVGTSKLLSNKLTIEIDFGQENSYWSQRDTQLRDANDKLLTFNSMIDALNFMTSHGYEFIQAYAFSVSSQNVYHYLLRKRRG
ncbi:hypothetical protein WBJ53_14820 [Spirosoma sp. SC4-14]|uniref:hypothetical protein n=1 Tax=Spirosoma sp. SC4-14 TaxID=3128900 RepID=UPI0030D2D48A